MNARDKALDEPRRRLVRTGVVRAFIASVAVMLLILPVGIDAGSGVVRASILEAMIELSQGRIGVGILSGFVAGGDLAREAAYRVGLAFLAWVAFVLAGIGRPRDEEAPRPSRRVRCAHCGSWASTAMADCPSCARPLVWT